jgi:hypothetical protein
MRRIRGFLFDLIAVLFELGIIAAILVFVQYTWHPFDELLPALGQGQNVAGRTLSAEAVAGITFGTLALALVLSFVPLLSKGVNKKQYLSNFNRSILAAFVYFLTERLYSALEAQGGRFLIWALLGAMVATFLLIEFVVRLVRVEQETSLRTDLLASISSGLAFGIIVRLGGYGFQALSARFGS